MTTILLTSIAIGTLLTAIFVIAASTISKSLGAINDPRQAKLGELLKTIQVKKVFIVIVAWASFVASTAWFFMSPTMFSDRPLSTTENIAFYIMPTVVFGYGIYKIMLLYSKIELYEQGLIIHNILPQRSILKFYSEVFFEQRRLTGKSSPRLFDFGFWTYWVVEFKNDDRRVRLHENDYKRLDDSMEELEEYIEEYYEG